jgi:hypothetical protein
MRAFRIGRAALIAAAAALSLVPRPASAQLGYDRPGGDYASAAIANGDPAACAARCERDKACRSWTFSYPSSDARRPALCRLKRAVMPPVKSRCCVSGVRGARMIEPHGGGLEYFIDRVGGDYRSFEPDTDQRAKSCAAVCKADARCRAWTYSRPGYGSPAARCYLKDRIKRPRRRPCCISGVVR